MHTEVDHRSSGLHDLNIEDLATAPGDVEGILTGDVPGSNHPVARVPDVDIRSGEIVDSLAGECDVYLLGEVGANGANERHSLGHVAEVPPRNSEDGAERARNADESKFRG
jgi:hypothetical protein